MGNRLKQGLFFGGGGGQRGKGHGYGIFFQLVIFFTLLTN